jgi:hypothetical protein
MRFLLLMSDDGLWERVDDDQRRAIMQAHVDFAAAANARARIVAGEALAAPGEVLTLRAAQAPDGRRVTDGPFTETAEQLGGFYLLEAESRDVVVDLCRILPASYTLQIWPAVDVDLEGM